MKPIANRNQNRGSDWNSWAEWLAASRRMEINDAWLWLMNEIDRIAEGRGVDKEEAERILDQRLKAQRRLAK